jgi:1,4-alpha-glucan branching enzyme
MSFSKRTGCSRRSPRPTSRWSRLLDRLSAEELRYQVTLSVSSPLLTMLGDPLLKQRYERHLEQLIALTERELCRTATDRQLQQLARYYHERLVDTRRYWRALGGDLVAPLARLQRAGYIELITSCATHGYLPLLAPQPAAAWAQIKAAVDLHHEVIGVAPRGIWLPECGYVAGVDQLVAKAGLRFFVSESHGLLHARPRARFGCYAPIFSADSGVAVFARDPQSAEQVWSRERGYPGDPAYRDFYRDIGFDLSQDDLGSLAGLDGRPRFTGIKYHRITGAGEHKELYDVELARERARQHARDFVTKRFRQLAVLRAAIPQPIVVAPYDAELFGHWWHEGVEWLEQVLRQVAAAPAGAPSSIGLGHYLEKHDTHQVARPAQSSWGEGGYHRYWLDGSNAWIYPRLHLAAERMTALARQFVAPTPLEQRALRQAARELLLAQASDWAFIIRTNTVVDYAVQRTERHLACFSRLVEQLEQGEIDQAWLADCEQCDNIFPGVDYTCYAARDLPEVCR